MKKKQWDGYYVINYVAVGWAYFQSCYRSEEDEDE